MAIKEKWRGNVSEVEKGLQQNNENYKKYKNCENNKNYEILQGYG